MKHETNDWKLTAYALGELDAAEQAEIEAQLRRSPELHHEVEQIRATAGLLTRELQTAAPAGLTDAQRETIAAAAASNQWHDLPPATERRSAFPFPRKMWIPLSIAASLAIGAVGASILLPSLSRARELSVRHAGKSSMADGSLRKTADEKKLSHTGPVGIPAGVATIGDPRNLGEVGASYVALNSSEQQQFLPSAATVSRGAPQGVFGGAGGSGGGQGVFVSGGGQVVLSKVRAYAETYDISEVAPHRPIRAWPSRAAFQPVQESTGFEIEELSPDAMTGLGYVIGPRDPSSTERYNPIVENPFTLVESQPLSTFSIDVDTAAYANIRRYLTSGRLPPADAVRIEEMVNYFDYNYPPPTGEHPFSVNLEISDCPWSPEHRLARIGIKGYEFDPRERPAANLVFLIDVSGSMNTYDKLPLVQESLALLIDQLDRRDSMGMVVYAGASGIVLEPTNGANKNAIRDAVDRLQAGGSTNGGAGIQMAYEFASQSFIEGGINRVILATDGDFNVGVTGQGELQRLIEEKAKTGVFLSVLGFGMGNLQDATLETLADKGNGNYAYIDTIEEARKVLVDQMGGTLFTIAKDVKIQVEFNPLAVAAYRLVGYENRMLAAQDFNDDRKDAGEIGAGHTVTAFYEIVPAGQVVEVPAVDALKYQTVTDTTPAAESGEMMTVKLRYKEPDGEASKLIEVPVGDAGATFVESSDDFAFAAAVASFGMLLRGSPHAATLDYPAVLEMAETARGDDPFGYRAEFIELVQRAMQLQPAAVNTATSP